MYSTEYKIESEEGIEIGRVKLVYEMKSIETFCQICKQQKVTVRPTILEVIEVVDSFGNKVDENMLWLNLIQHAILQLNEDKELIQSSCGCDEIPNPVSEPISGERTEPRYHPPTPQDVGVQFKHDTTEN